MKFKSFDPLVLVAIKNWRILMFTGMLSVVLGIYIFNITYDIYTELSLLLAFTFIMASLSGISFSLHNQVSDIWTGFLVYAGSIFAFEMFMMIYYNVNLLFFTLGSISLFHYVQLLGTVNELKRCNDADHRLINWTCILGITFSVPFIFSPLLNLKISKNFTIGLLFTVLGISSFFLAIELRRIDLFYKRIERLLKDLKEKDV
ncbi:hypothetical protein [Elizabethkingia anophelis]|uniref:hypothetical protein n=1 Tax=Elizabethkingia anophelis TaxID=1117645 RepID=UPI00389260AA|nr:hypothetical protein [Elizabethkingia anophelis]